MDVSKLKTNDWIVLAGTALGFIAMFLHWYSVSVMGVSQGSGGSGWDESLAVLGFFAMLAAGAICLLKAFGVDLPLPVSEGLAVLALGALSVLIVLIKFIDKPGGGGNFFGVEVKIGYSVGIFIMLVAAALVALGGFLKNSESV